LHEEPDVRVKFRLIADTKNIVRTHRAGARTKATQARVAHPKYPKIGLFLLSPRLKASAEGFLLPRLQDLG